MNDELSNVRALIEAKIAAREERLRARIRSCDEEVCCASLGGSRMSPPEPRSRCRAGAMPILKPPSPTPHPPDLHAANLSFAARVVIAVRDKFGGDAPRVYKAAGVTAAAYSQIVSDETHRVSKRTAIRFAFALRLDPNGAALLLKSAGFAFSNSQTEDFVLQSCLETDPPIYDFGTVNELLNQYQVKYRY